MPVYGKIHLMDIINWGTCKFVTPDVVFENWIYDITALETGEQEQERVL
jgi:hypothetical protein